MSGCNTISCPTCGSTLNESFVEQKCPRCQTIIESKFICGSCHNCADTISERKNNTTDNLFTKLAKLFK